MSYLVWGRCGHLPLTKQGRAVAQVQACGGKRILGCVCSSLCLPSHPAVPEEHLQRKHWSWPHLVLCTKGERPCAWSVLAHQAPLGVALAGGCAVQRRLAACSALLHSWTPVFLAVSKWPACGNLLFPKGFVGPLGNSGQRWNYFQLWWAKCELTLGKMPRSTGFSCQKSSPSSQRYQAQYSTSPQLKTSDGKREQGDQAEQKTAERVKGNNWRACAGAQWWCVTTEGWLLWVRASRSCRDLLFLGWAEM